MADKRHCDRNGCTEYVHVNSKAAEDQFKTVSFKHGSGGSCSLHFCSDWCLASWAVNAITPKDWKETGPVVRISQFADIHTPVEEKGGV